MTVDTAEDLYIPTYDDVLAAHERVRPYIHRTPILTSRFINELAGAELFFKCENFQKAGAFKVRGACNAVFGLSDEKARKGVATHSSRQPRAVALLRRRPPRHPLPRGDAAHRAAGEEGRGASATAASSPSASPRPPRARRSSPAVQAETGADFVHPYNDERVIAGQGTCSKEIDRGPRRARRRRRPDRRRRHDLRHLPDALEHRAADEDLRRRARAGRRRLPVVQAGQDRRLRRARHRRRRPQGAAQGAHLALRLAATSPTC